MPSDSLYQALAQALSQPSRAYRAAQAGLDIPQQALKGYSEGADLADKFRQRKLKQQTLGEALGHQPVEEGIMNLTGEGGDAQKENLSALAAILKAQKEASQKATQLFGVRGDKGLVYDPNATAISEIPIPPGDGPIIQKAVSQTISPYADPSTGQPLAFTPGRGLSPAASSGGGGVPVLKQGNEQAISDAAVMQTQIPNIDTLYDAYKAKGPIAARLQATPAGSVLDPVAKQAENSLKLAAFTFGGKALTEQEKDVVFGAFFPSITDNAQSLENKRNLLKEYFAGKVDLLQAANLLGPAGAPLRGMLQNKTRSVPPGSVGQNPTAQDPGDQAAVRWLNANPNAPTANAVRAKLRSKRVIP